MLNSAAIDPSAIYSDLIVCESAKDLAKRNRVIRIDCIFALRSTSAVKDDCRLLYVELRI
ncbi:hypothetical protein CR103_21290 [Massilia psychrophila]|uniref:Uncharacterized protein n=1 Tax=Massilia psychrophila TaxID=1603353 RepID=A0A2G8SVN2_9BURK|nr:hypothetical protein CR103_21290 [Massilia psychrophila]GGE92584.1 hypothetical protein GCM10008020_42010 [Massilia psychrophila]